jgi:hypothetical protein
VPELLSLRLSSLRIFRSNRFSRKTRAKQRHRGCTTGAWTRLKNEFMFMSTAAGHSEGRRPPPRASLPTVPTTAAPGVRTWKPGLLPASGSTRCRSTKASGSSSLHAHCMEWRRNCVPSSLRPTPRRRVPRRPPPRGVTRTSWREITGKYFSSQINS